MEYTQLGERGPRVSRIAFGNWSAGGDWGSVDRDAAIGATRAALDLGWVMHCEVHRALSFEGELRVDDPDGIVVDAAFFPVAEVQDRLEACFHWVREPLAEWLDQRWEPAQRRGFSYDVRGTALDSLEVIRTLDS